MKNKLKLGCIADDFTGASDAASFLVKGGLKTVLFNGIPKDSALEPDCEAVVIALKTRTQETTSAVSDTLTAADWLKAHGAEQLYIKYCSTFDSTPKGNIGPILDALLERYEETCSILCPALPVNGRIVRDGRLYVNGVPLDESPMKNHPLTPMWDSSIKNLMEAQSRYSCLNLNEQELKEPAESIREKIEKFGAAHSRFYLVPDYVEPEDAERIVELFGSLPILSGGSGLLTALAGRYAEAGTEAQKTETGTEGAGILLAGSCSEMTRKQIAYAQSHGIPSLKMDPEQLMSGAQSTRDLWAFLQEHAGSAVLIYSSDTPEQVRKIQQLGTEKVAGLLEQTTAELARMAVDAGYTRIIVAGGETSGAVTKALGFDSYLIGESVAPGVPVMIPRSRQEVRLVLKSGNFGQEDFFLRALDCTKKA